MVKICGITRRQDAEAAAEAGASAIGFVFYPKSPRYITPEQAAAVAEGLTPLKVGVFVDEPAETVQSTALIAKLDVVQLYGGKAPGGLRIWRAFRVSERLPVSPEAAEAVLLDGPATGVPFNWSNVGQVVNLQRVANPPGPSTIEPGFQPAARLLPGDPRPPLKLILAGGLDSTNVAEAIRIVRPWGVDASSRLESAPGIKDHQKVRAFIRAAREAA